MTHSLEDNGPDDDVSSAEKSRGRGRPAKHRVNLHVQINPETYQGIVEIASYFKMSQGDAVNLVWLSFKGEPFDELIRAHNQLRRAKS